MNRQPDNMLGESNALTTALDHLSQLATIQRPVLVLGERGTGKELAAERLHFLSSRWDAPFIKVNCAAMAETLLESELFGHEVGAFTGASRLHVGRFERAEGGTLLLDEIGTMSPRLQEKLLRLIEYGEYERVGGQRTLRVDVRVIGSTNADLRSMADTQTFRADLLDRLSFDVVHMPALRHRDDDVMLLARHFAVQMSAELTWDQFPGFAPAALLQLREYHWPGNVRELKNVVERSLHRWGAPETAVATLVIDPFKSPWSDAHSPSATAPDPQKDGQATIHNDVHPAHTTPRTSSNEPENPQGLRDSVDAYEKTLLIASLEQHALNQRRTAEALGLSYDQLRGLVRKHQLQPNKRGRA
ncbi:phage shock protein operon transcriptional activator [Congregibacter variabilis]|uniref:Phage shock protein operon transcriptional activator n=1 Tax=Congregibacter variabilis TaxID=3081200 RepID=A0ABZ0I452_9GAMM|nr:phage shock protein operon transcriptional activator [Congregibacter sp. IMCC43200]